MQINQTGTNYMIFEQGIGLSSVGVFEDEKSAIVYMEEIYSKEAIANKSVMIQPLRRILTEKEEKTMKNCNHKNSVFIWQSEPFKVQDGDILVHKRYKCNDCNEEFTDYYCDYK